MPRGDFGPGARWAAQGGVEWAEAAAHFGRWRRCSAPEWVLLHAGSGGLSGNLQIELASLSRKDTRIRATLTMQASGLRDRMFLNALVLTRARLARRFADMVSGFARVIEGRAERA